MAVAVLMAEAELVLAVPVLVLVRLAVVLAVRRPSTVLVVA
jgi:hypothetical protein